MPALGNVLRCISERSTEPTVDCDCQSASVSRLRRNLMGTALAMEVQFASFDASEIENAVGSHLEKLQYRIFEKDDVRELSGVKFHEFLHLRWSALRQRRQSMLFDDFPAQCSHALVEQLVDLLRKKFPLVSL